MLFFFLFFPAKKESLFLPKKTGMKRISPLLRVLSRALETLPKRLPKVLAVSPLTPPLDPAARQSRAAHDREVP